MPNQLVLAKQAGEELKVLSAELESDSEEYMQLKQEIENNKDGKIIVNQTIFPGVSMIISNRVYPIKDALTHCQFYVKDADVVSSPV